MSAEKANTKRAGWQSRISTSPACRETPFGLGEGGLSIFAEGVGSLTQCEEQLGESDPTPFLLQVTPSRRYVSDFFSQWHKVILTNPVFRQFASTPMGGCDESLGAGRQSTTARTPCDTATQLSSNCLDHIRGRCWLSEIIFCQRSKMRFVFGERRMSIP